MSEGQIVSFSLVIARQRQALADLLVLGVVNGGFVGPGVEITSRESLRICFLRKKTLFSSVPVQGEIRLSSEKPGETIVECRVQCLWSPWALVVQLLIITAFQSVLTFGAGVPLLWLIYLYGVVIGLYLIKKRWHCARLKERMVIFCKNLSYLKSI